ncbi:MAG: hypothetical protein OXH00_12400 [Candidatus Poribacteria bacterium]|nr:hypothetical protein [Candidatus Poribacteria bacterium]
MRYDKNRFKIQALPHPLNLLWVLFPAFMFNELIFGQRVPKVTLIDKESDKPLEERTYIPCPHCETLNDRRLWATKGNAFGHWFGLVCPSCHQIIPCLWNIFSLAILAITFPLWYFPVRFFRHRWIEKEKERLAKVLERPLISATSIHSMGWIGDVSVGVSVAVTGVILEVVRNVWRGREWDLKTMLESLPMWVFAGFVSACLIGWLEKETKKQKERLANVRERPLIRAIRAKSIKSTIKSINLFLKGTIYFGGGMWVAFAVWEALTEREWDLRMMFDMLPLSLLFGFILGCFMYVLVSLTNLKAERPESDSRND